MTANRRGPCAVCSLPIELGEVITYERTVGARHMACAELNANRRRNLYAMPCDLCGVRLLRGHGELTVDEMPTVDAKWRRRWRARCVDVQACIKRSSASR